MSFKKTVSGTHTWLVLGKAYQAFARVSRSHIQTLELGGVTDFAVLEVLLHKGPLPVNTIGKKLFLTSGSMTVAIDRLTMRGLVRRVAHPEDRRVILVELTEAGRALIEEAFAEHREVMDGAFSALSGAERKTLVRLLKKAGKAALGK